MILLIGAIMFWLFSVLPNLAWAILILAAFAALGGE